MKKIILIVCLTISSLFIFAQSEMDAFRFSNLDWQGSARFMGAGGAFGAVGGDFSAVSTNPASLGVFKKSSFSVTPIQLSFNNVASRFMDNTNLYTTTKYTMSSAGFVWVLGNIDNTRWEQFQFAFGYNRIADFNQRKFIVDGESNSSIGMHFADLANGYAPKDMIDEALFAWESYLIDPTDVSNLQYGYLHNDAVMNQRYSVTTNGGIDEMTISVGSNWDNKLYLGATMGVPFISYSEYSRYVEKDEYNQIPIFQELTVKDNLKINGIGINLKLGLLYQPAKFVRFGIAFHTPTYYGKLKYNLTRDMSSIGDSASVEKDFTNFNYFKLVTPMRAMFNTAFLIKKRAFISAEYEIANYGAARLSPYIYFDDYTYSAENQQIREALKVSHIARVGAEVNLTEKFLIRAGYKFQSSPYKDKSLRASYQSISAGLGYRGKHFAFDVAYIYATSGEKFWFYNPQYVEESILKYSSHRIALSCEFKF